MHMRGFFCPLRNGRGGRKPHSIAFCLCSTDATTLLKCSPQRETNGCTAGVFARYNAAMALPLRRWTINILFGLSLLLSAVTVLLWIRSYWAADFLMRTWPGGQRQTVVSSSFGPDPVWVTRDPNGFKIQIRGS